ncbi:MAG: hypothetical protein HOV81_22660 [Kofleriaceae bacterium]|nr:hypothetical protein [Kofleriaceae bacterium]
MSVTIEIATAELRTENPADPGHHLKPGGRDEVSAEIERLRSRGAVAHVLVVDRGDPLAHILTAWDALGYDADHDLLLVYDTHDWVGRGWGLDDAKITRVLDEARPHQRTTYAHALVGALQRLADARFARKDDSVSLVWPITGGVGIAALGAVIGLAIRRRHRIAEEGLANLGEARASAERAYSEVMLASEELPGGAAELQLRAAELKKRIDDVVRRVEADPARGTDPVEIGRLRQLENELAALHSTVLQKEKR